MKPNFDYSLGGLGIDSFKEFASRVSNSLKALVDTLNNSVTFRDNIKSNVVKSLVFTSGVELGVSHNLGVIPLGFLIVSKTTAADIRSGSSDWTTDRINLIANANVVADIIILGG